jgi:hypothetical protein
LLAGAGFVVDEHSLVDDETPFGLERWLWVIAHSVRSPAQ